MSREIEVDEAFGLFRENVLGYLGWDESSNDVERLPPELGTVLGGSAVRMEVESLEIETPVELDVLIGADGEVQLGCAPPLYRLQTGILPVFHRLKLTIVPEHELVESNPSATDRLRSHSRSPTSGPTLQRDADWEK